MKRNESIGINAAKREERGQLKLVTKNDIRGKSVRKKDVTAQKNIASFSLFQWACC